LLSNCRACPATSLTQRYDARFELDQHRELKLRLELDLADEGIANGSHIHGNEPWEFDDEGCMRRRDESINDYEIDEPECKVRWER
jgi:nuclear transport factor 2 (NTF2) superfamily protein